MASTKDAQVDLVAHKTPLLWRGRHPRANLCFFRFQSFYLCLRCCWLVIKINTVLLWLCSHHVYYAIEYDFLGNYFHSSMRLEDYWSSYWIARRGKVAKTTNASLNFSHSLKSQWWKIIIIIRLNKVHSEYKEIRRFDEKRCRQFYAWILYDLLPVDVSFSPCHRHFSSSEYFFFSLW